MSLSEQRRAIRPLLQPQNPADAQAAYYVFHHPDDKTKLVTLEVKGGKTAGYVCLSRTGIDLFRPLVTMRLPFLSGTHNLDLVTGADLLRRAIPPSMPVIVNAPASYLPLLTSLFEVTLEQELKLLVLDRKRFEPIINVLVRQADSYNGLPRYIIRMTADNKDSNRGEIVASAGVNWQSDRFADIYVHTKSPYRRKGLGRSVVAALVDSILKNSRTPLYIVQEGNQPSINLAESVGFVDIGVNQLLIEGHLREVSASSSSPREL